MTTATEIKTITRETAKRKIMEAGAANQLFGVTFIKIDGSERKMTCRFGASNVAEEVNKTGQKVPYSQLQNEMRSGSFRVLDVNKLDEDQRPKPGAFRKINIKTLIELRTNGKTYQVID